MRRSLVFSVVALLLCIGLVWQLSQQNVILGAGHPDTDYLHFNRSDPKRAQAIMDAWRLKPERTDAAKRIVLLDYLLIIVYTSYLCWAILRRQKSARIRKDAHWELGWLLTALMLVTAGALLDAIQDTIIYLFVSAPSGRAYSLQLFTWFKFRFLLVGIAILLLSLIPVAWLKRFPGDWLLGRVQGFLKAFWLFFPSVLFISLTILCFWVRGQGKDILLAFAAADKQFFRLVFYFVVAFWVYMTWYSSRVIGHIKATDERIPHGFLDNYPRLAGNACLLVIELALLQAPFFAKPLGFSAACWIFLIALIIFYRTDKWISQFMIRLFGRLNGKARWLFALYLILLILVEFLPFAGHVYCLLAMLFILHFLYLLYVNMRRQAIKNRYAVQPADSDYIRMADAKGFSETVLAFFCIKREEAGYVPWLIGLTILVIIIDVVAFLNLSIARDIGPFAILLLGFAMLLALGNFITALSVKLRFNLHFLLIIFTVIVGGRETHEVKQVQLPAGTNEYTLRPSLKQYLTTWLRRVPDSDSAYDMYFVLANGGASRSGYWTASVLGRLEDSSRKICPDSSFSKHVFCLSGTSGGGVGVATFFGLMKDQRRLDSSYTASAQQFLKQDYFTYTVARMLGPDYFNYIFHIARPTDRARALEESFEDYSDTTSYYRPGFDRPFSEFRAMNADSSQVLLPILFVNTTQMQDGTPGIVTNLKVDPAYFNQRVDVVGQLAADSDISLASGAILGARFPYLSPAGRIGQHYFVDGGYFDNSGAGVVQELLRGIMTIAWDGAQKNDSTILKKLKRVHIKVLHIVNSPVNGSEILEAVPPIKNDLLSPVLTIVGAYDMQTTVNDQRLYHYVGDLQKYYGINAEHRMISLYLDAGDSAKTEAAYSMNWFMSDSLRRRIDQRLMNQHAIKTVMTQPGFTSCKKP